MEIELPDGTVLDVPDDADVRKVVDGYRQSKWAKRDPTEYDAASPEFKRKYSAAEQEKTLVGIADPKTGVDLSRLPEDQRERFFKESAKSLGAVTRKGKQLKDLTPDEQAEYWAAIDQTASPKMNYENTAAGLGSGAMRASKGLTNLLLPDSLTPAMASDQELRNMDERDEDLPTIPKLLGGVAATAPLSAGTGAALGAGSRAAGAGSMLGKALASPITRATVEGAEQGAIYADPAEQGKGALKGGALAFGLNRLGAVGGRLLRGLAKKSAEAVDLEHLAGQHGEEIFVPLSQAAGSDDVTTRLVKTLYKEGLPIVPGVKGRLEKQSAEAADKLREIAVRDSVPTGGTVPADAGSKPLLAVANVKRQLDEVYDSTIKLYTFDIPQNLTAELEHAIKSTALRKASTPSARLAASNTTVNDETTQSVTKLVEDLIKKFSSGKTRIDGSNLLTVKEEISRLMRGASRTEKLALESADQYVDDIITNSLKQGGAKQNLDDLQRYLDNSSAYRSYKPVAQAAEGAADKEGRFLFSTLAQMSKKSPEQRSLGQLGAATVEKPVASTSKTGQLLANLAVPGAALGAYMAPQLTALIMGGAHGLTSKTAQKALMGDLQIQRFLAKLLRDNPKLKAALGSGARGAAVQQMERP